METSWDSLHVDRAQSGELRLRLATEADLPEILRVVLDPTSLVGLRETAEYVAQTLHRLWYEEPEGSGLRHFVAERTRDGALIAYLRLEYPFNTPGCLWLTFLCIAPEYRRKGYGREIMTLLTTTATRSGSVREFGIHTCASNAAAIGLYQSSGFRCVKREPWQGWNGDASDRLTFCRVLGGAADGGRVEGTSE